MLCGLLLLAESILCIISLSIMTVVFIGYLIKMKKSKNSLKSEDLQAAESEKFKIPKSDKLFEKDK
jgi:hypothetical protein